MSCPKVTPAIFFGHGSPMNAIEQNKFTNEWISVMERYSEPKVILAISAHWETKGTKITNNKIQKTIHDFGGFPQELFNVQYNPKGDQELVKRIQNLVPEAAADDSWGLDHGIWSILKNIYPKANIPVVRYDLKLNINLKNINFVSIQIIFDCWKKLFFFFFFYFILYIFLKKITLFFHLTNL